jgi:hypothetical protein
MAQSAGQSGRIPGFGKLFAWRIFAAGLNPDIPCFTRNANSPERRLAVGFTVAMTRKADYQSALRTRKCEISGLT